MLGSLVYFSLDIVFNIIFWTGKKTFSGMSMLYYYYNDIDDSEKKIDLNKLQNQINNQSKLIEELNNKLKKVD
jgi:hypothetical protein